jgi:ABC-2 type transport system permease protein
MKRFLTFSKAMLLIHLRNTQVLFWNFGFPVFLMLIYGAIMRPFMQWMTPGVIVLNALSFGLVGASAMMLEMREKGILRRLRATPMPALQLVGSYLLINLVLGLLQGALILLAAVVLYRVPLSAAGLLLALPMMLAAALTFLALGGVISGMAPKAGVATGAGMTLYFSLMFITDMIFPISELPAWLQRLAPYTPSYVAAQLVRGALLNGALDAAWPGHLALLAVYAVAGALLAGRLFRWDPQE